MDRSDLIEVWNNGKASKDDLIGESKGGVKLSKSESLKSPATRGKAKKVFKVLDPIETENIMF